MEQEPEKSSIEYKCPYLDQCCFIQDNIERMPELIRRIQERYCAVEDVVCARRYLYDGISPNAVPPLMLPEQIQWARQIIEECEGDEKNNSRIASVQSNDD